MNQRLLQAAWNGDVDYLLKQINTNPSMLHAAALEGGENPLHITCLAGHLSFALTVVKLRQQFSWELNQDGFSPLHIAASCGHVEKLLNVDLGLCLIEGKDKKIPLHLAVVKVKNHQFKALQVLLQHLIQVNKEDLLNSKDLHGNTILHLAVSRKQYEVVEFLLNRHKEKMEWNSLNNSGLTPLDMLLMFQSEAGDHEIEELLIQAGTLKAENLQSQAYTQERPNHPESDTRHEHPRSLTKKMLDYNVDEYPLEVRGTLLVIVTLITAATYQPALSPPGGIWQDDSCPSTVNNSSSSAMNNTTATKPHTAGQAIMLTNDPLSFAIFLFANSVGFYASLNIIGVLTRKFPLRMELHILVFAISVTYSACILAIAPNRLIAFGFIVVSILTPFFIPIRSKLLRNIFNRPRNATANARQGRV